MKELDFFCTAELMECCRNLMVSTAGLMTPAAQALERSINLYQGLEVPWVAHTQHGSRQLDAVVGSGAFLTPICKVSSLQPSARVRARSLEHAQGLFKQTFRSFIGCCRPQGSPALAKSACKKNVPGCIRIHSNTHEKGSIISPCEVTLRGYQGEVQMGEISPI